MQQDSDLPRRLPKAEITVGDTEFDSWLPDHEKAISYRFWTPAGVALRVVRWFAETGAQRVLDVGSGVGKFCVVGALGSRLTFTGVEHRPHLITMAEDVAERFGVSERVTFVGGEVNAVNFREFDALYFYNPFGEHRFPVAEHLDSSVEINRRRFDREVADVESRLGQVRVGTCLATFNGYGGRVPGTFDLIHAQILGGTVLRLWRKVRNENAGGYWLELEESTVRHEAGGSAFTLLPTPEDEDSQPD